MEVLPIDVVGLVAVIMGTLIVLIPVAGMTLRYALKPVVSVLDRYLRGQEKAEANRLAERRLAILEEQLDDMQRTLARLAEGAEFDARLERGADQASLPSVAGPSTDGDSDA